MKLKDATCDRNDASNIELVESTYMDKDSDTFFWYLHMYLCKWRKIVSIKTWTYKFVGC